MKSLVWVGPRRFEMQEIATPKPGRGELLLKVSMVGICGSDLSGYLGENSLRKPPLVMGHEVGATVVDMAEDVTGWSLGQLVTVNPLLSCGSCRACRSGMRQLCPNRKIIGIHRPGAFAEYFTAPAAACFAIDGELEATLVEPLACAVRANTQAKVGLADDVVVMGAGIIGLMSIWIAKQMGAKRRIVVDTNSDRLAKAMAWGATEVVNPRTMLVIEQIEQICPDGVDRAIDAVGTPETRLQCIQLVRAGGRVALVGLHNDATEVPGNTLVRQEIEVVGSFCYTDTDFRRALQLVSQGSLTQNRDWVDIRTLKDGQVSFEEQIFGPAVFPKIVLQVSELYS